MTITPERLAELRKGLATSAAWGCTTEQVNVEELRDLLDAADNLNALLAAPEYSVSKEEEDAIVSEVLRRSRADDSLKAACERIAPWLSAALSDPSVSAEWKESCGALLAALAASNANARGGQ